MSSSDSANVYATYVGLAVQQCGKTIPNDNPYPSVIPETVGIETTQNWRCIIGFATLDTVRSGSMSNPSLLKLISINSIQNIGPTSYKGVSCFFAVGVRFQIK